jgi:hypothetical protein
MHYSKENKEAYAASRARKKAAAEARRAPAKTKASYEMREGFAVPGAVIPLRPAAEKREAAEGRSSAAIPSAALQPERGARAETRAYQTATAPAGRAGNFGDTVVLNDGAPGATTSLADGGGGEAPHLVRYRNNEKIKLSKPVFRIGKERSFADYFIGDNAAISRGHAEFASRGGEYFVSDMNSTNHTYVNGAMLAGGAEAKLEHGDKVRLADEEFEFRLY